MAGARGTGTSLRLRCTSAGTTLSPSISRLRTSRPVGRSTATPSRRQSAAVAESWSWGRSLGGFTAPLACLENDDTSVRPESWEPHRGEARGSKHQEAATAGAECSPTASQPGWAAPSPSSELLDSGGRVLCLLRAGLDLSLRSQGSDPLHNGEGVHPYHALRTATSGNPRQRFWLVRAVFAAIPFATGCHRLRPLCSIGAPRFGRNPWRRSVWRYRGTVGQLAARPVDRGSRAPTRRWLVVNDLVRPCCGSARTVRSEITATLGCRSPRRARQASSR